MEELRKISVVDIPVVMFAGSPEHAAERHEWVKLFTYKLLV
jgi:hypothetical protein